MFLIINQLHTGIFELISEPHNNTRTSISLKYLALKKLVSEDMCYERNSTFSVMRVMFNEKLMFLIPVSLISVSLSEQLITIIFD